MQVLVALDLVSPFGSFKPRQGVLHVGNKETRNYMYVLLLRENDIMMREII